MRTSLSPRYTDPPRISSEVRLGRKPYRDLVGFILEGVCTSTILGCTLALFCLLGGCSNGGTSDTDLSLKTKIQVEKPSSNSPSKAEPLPAVDPATTRKGS